MSRQRPPRPAIGICTALERARWGMWEQEAVLLPRSYVEAVQAAGGLALMLPPGRLPAGGGDARRDSCRDNGGNDAAANYEAEGNAAAFDGYYDAAAPGELLDRIDGLMLAGGADIDPAAYGAEPHSHTTDTVPERDRFEIALVRAAIERDMPVLGICRGMQLINVAFGGTLLQHLPERFGHHEHLRVAGTFDGADHDVDLVEGSLAARAAGETSRHATKSHHHQGVDVLGEGLRVTGNSCMDGLPEAIEVPGRRFVLGVQWHPEADAASRVVGALVRAAEGYMRERASASEQTGGGEQTAGGKRAAAAGPRTVA